MDRKDLQRRAGNKIRMIRFQHLNEDGRSMKQKEFCDLLNSIEPTDLKIEPVSLGMYERGDQNCPSDKYEKILSLNVANK